MRHIYKKMELFQDKQYHLSLIKSAFSDNEIKNMKILDFGCGSGQAARVFVEKGASYVIGVDISPMAISRAKHLLRKFNNAKFIEADLNIYKFKKNQYDIVFSHSVLHCLSTDLPKVITAIFESLKPGGTFYFTLARDSIGMRIQNRIRKILSATMPEKAGGYSIIYSYRFIFSRK